MQKDSFVSIRRKLLLPIITVGIAVLCALLFTACAERYSLSDLEKEYPVRVIYDYMGGKDTNDQTTRHLQVKENSYLPAPASSAGVPIPTRDGYSFKRYVVAQTDEDGKVISDANGRPIPTEREWNFKSDRVADKAVTLCAEWWENFKVNYKYGADYSLTKTVGRVSRNVDGTPASAVIRSIFDIEGYTALSYNLVQGGGEDTELKTFPYSFKAEDFAEDNTVTVYGETLDGEYTVVRTASDLSLVTYGEDKNIYLLNDIDLRINGKNRVYTDRTDGLPRTYNGKFYGNGHKISGFTLNLSTINISYTNFGLFRSLGPNAEIKDVTFEDFKLDYSIGKISGVEINIGMLAGSVERGAIVDNVRFAGNSTYQYNIEVGVEHDSLTHESTLFGTGEENGEITDVTIADTVEIVLSDAVYSSDADHRFIVYVNYTEDGDTVKITGAYAIAEKNSSGSYSPRTCVEYNKITDTTYEFVRRANKLFTYSIELSVIGKDISASVSVTETDFT